MVIPPKHGNNRCGPIPIFCTSDVFLGPSRFHENRSPAVHEALHRIFQGTLEAKRIKGLGESGILLDFLDWLELFTGHSQIMPNIQNVSCRFFQQIGWWPKRCPKASSLIPFQPDHRDLSTSFTILRASFHKLVDIFKNLWVFLIIPIPALIDMLLQYFNPQ